MAVSKHRLAALEKKMCTTRPFGIRSATDEQLCKVLGLGPDVSDGQLESIINEAAEHSETYQANNGTRHT